MFISNNFNGDPNVGLYAFATDKFCISGIINKKLKEVLKVPVIICPVMNTNFAGLFGAANSSGVILPKVAEDFPIGRFPADVLFLDTYFTAIGNLILLNDNGVIISSLLRKHKGEIGKFFGLPCEVSTIAGINIPGSTGFATNKGCLLHPNVKEKEKNLIEKILQVETDVGTVSFGSPFVKSGIICNSNGCMVSDQCTGPEQGRINDTLLER